MASKNYRDLIAWQKAMDLVEQVYHATRHFPKEEQFCLCSQIRRAVVSIPSNVAEGQGRQTPKEFTNFLYIAHGSLREVETQLLIAQRLLYLSEPQVVPMLNLSAEVGRLIRGLINSL